ncbi:flagellar basal body rod protein FlgB [Atopomonas sediminilitoris]|uniref:flagellar basal body rod protein FlgB n=1 Tax=Atopomonas sediminilitoris TaxID=2919919 RepID=UPI001F4E8E6E|nr:flagellar basal body rod protein FlgB [Atopomonas sediminilitoris]MCJ8167972.1 flagellar basal body rod protein FlgB [Atopomonas sediminilitoris]
MSISFDKALGIHQQALSFRSQRAGVLANNLANADTPHFRARELDFSAVLAEQAGQQGQKGFAIDTTNSRHIDVPTLQLGEGALRYRNPLGASVDDSAVDVHVEQAAYAQNAVDFQASFTFLNSKFKGLISALRGD